MSVGLEALAQKAKDQASGFIDVNAIMQGFSVTDLDQVLGRDTKSYFGIIFDNYN